jgi:ribosomal-protein-alanine N-acetyltransferase
MTMALRPATPADAPACAELDQLCFPPNIAYDRETFAEIFAQAKVILIAEDDGRMIGFVAAEIGADEPTALIITLDVDPARRRQGVGSQLLAAAHARLVELGAQTAYLHVAVRSVDAQRLYRRHGYSTVGRLRDYYGPRDDAFVMARALVERDD